MFQGCGELVPAWHFGGTPTPPAAGSAGSNRSSPMRPRRPRAPPIVPSHPVAAAAPLHLPRPKTLTNWAATATAGQERHRGSAEDWIRWRYVPWAGGLRQPSQPSYSAVWSHASVAKLRRFIAHVLYSIHKNSNAVPRLHVSENSVSETGVSVWGLIDAPCTRCVHSCVAYHAEY